MPHPKRSPSGLLGSKANYLRERTAVTIISKVKHVIPRKKQTNKQTSFTQLNIFREVLLKFLRPYAEQIRCLRFETLKNGLISNPCGVERKNAKTSKSVLSQMNKPQS